uniref:CSON013439 protein n=1 Tax=Culicoides sonorensis TaxID=179676 RepID=A0A336MCE2_CULSO
MASKASAVKVITGSSNSNKRIKPTKNPLSTTTDDTPDFDRNKVSLQVPDELFGNSFTLVTNVSKLMGDFIMNSARRTADFFWIVQPLFKNSLTIENPPPTTSTESNDI